MCGAMTNSYTLVLTQRTIPLGDTLAPYEHCGATCQQQNRVEQKPDQASVCPDRPKRPALQHDLAQDNDPLRAGEGPSDSSQP
jgi:hypothetical protein